MTVEGRGRDTISARALQRVARAVVADQFEVDVRAVQADLSDEGGRLSLAVRTPVRVVSIGRMQQEPAALERIGGSILDRAARAEETIAARVTSITGSSVHRVSLRFTGAEISRERRVR